MHSISDILHCPQSGSRWTLHIEAAYKASSTQPQASEDEAMLIGCLLAPALVSCSLYLLYTARPLALRGCMAYRVVSLMPLS
jgi:hypothetical protein